MIEFLPPCTIVGPRARVTSMSGRIPLLWNELTTRCDEIGCRTGGSRWGIVGNWDPASHEFDYQAGVIVTDGCRVPNGMVHWELPGGDYAVFETTLSTIADVFDHMSATLREMGLAQIEGPTLECYGPDFDHEVGRFTIWVPVQTLTH